MKPFLITGHPRSGTGYISHVLSKLGLDVKHEDWGADGVSSYAHLLSPEKFSTIAHQTRHPLDVFKSVKTLSKYNSKHYERTCHLVGEDPMIPPEKPLIRIMWTWINWCKEADRVSSYRYQIEQLDEIYPDLYEALGIEADYLPESDDRNSRKDDPDYIEKITWDDLFKLDKQLAKQVKDLAKKYGYGR